MIGKLIESLLEAPAYPEPTANVTLTETHISYIFITDHFVYKVKKAVDFGFLDFTTPERRRFYCQEEVRLNSRLCPDIYLGVVELRETPQGASFAGGGKVIDYAVKMKRLPEERMLVHLLKQGQVGAQQMMQLALVIAQFHAKAATGPQIDAYGSPEAIRANWEENFSQTAPLPEEVLPAADLALMHHWVDRFFAEKGDLLRARVERGFIRECDGDLHLGNICLTDRICIFDCIEFNEKFRYIDTAADIAFLIMDLECAERPDLCRPFLESYQGTSGDQGLSAVLGFYLVYRAFIRGKVKGFRLSEPDLPPEQRAEAAASAARYFRLARGYTLRERLAPTLIVTCGLMGSGKSALAREISFQLGLSLLRSDVIRKQLAAVSGQSLAEYDQGIYSAGSNEATYAGLLQVAEQELSCGRSVLVDATFRRRSDRAAFRTLAERLGAGFSIIETQAPEALIRERLEKRQSDPNEVSDGRWELFPRQLREFEKPAKGEAIEVDSSLPLPAVVDQALRGMGLLA